MVEKKVAVLYHIFYEDSIEHIVGQLKCLENIKPIYLFNLSEDLPDKLETKYFLLQNFPGCIVSISSNQGKDIGAKLLLISMTMQLRIKPDWFIFLHDKKSLQALNAKKWKDDLLSIINCEQLEKVNQIILNSMNCGIIAAKNYVRKETRQGRQFVGKNGSILDELLDQYQLECKSFEYIAGTMFWAEARPMLNFFTKNDPLKIRQTLEYGNVLDDFSGSFTHSWERLLSWIITSKGMTIKTV